MNARSPAIAIPAGPISVRPSVLSQRLLNFVLFITVLTSSIAFIEPSPHDALMMVLLVACVAAHVSFDRKLIPLLMLLIAWLIGGLLALIHVGDDAKDIQYIATSMYLAIAGMMFACLFATGDLVRLNTMRIAYTLAAIIATTAGYIGFFHLLPGSDIFLFNDRVSATFKDPNVFGPFLIYPILLLIIAVMTRGLSVGRLLVLCFLLGGLFFSFSRGAWSHFAVSAAAAFVILLAVTRDNASRVRIVASGILAVVGVALFVIALTSVSSIHDMFLERAQVIQSYDVGPGGRFWLQEIALGTILENPSGLGPFEFDRINGLQQHNVYLQGFLVYGWLGGTAYLAMVIITLLIGLRAVVFATPWRNYLIAAYAGFLGECFEGMIVDTDHWRHFFLLLGLVWGLTAATINYQHSQYRQARYRQ